LAFSVPYAAFSLNLRKVSNAGIGERAALDVDSYDVKQELQISGPEPNRIDVNISWKLDFLVKSLYFIENSSSVENRYILVKMG